MSRVPVLIDFAGFQRDGLIADCTEGMFCFGLTENSIRRRHRKFAWSFFGDKPTLRITRGPAQEPKSAITLGIFVLAQNRFCDIRNFSYILSVFFALRSAPIACHTADGHPGQEVIGYRKEEFIEMAGHQPSLRGAFMRSTGKGTDQAQFLSGWKEIANYMGKGVRTIQRYERDLGFPVRRPAGKSTGSVVATKVEVDAWITAST